jgi:hypothetical protein
MPGVPSSKGPDGTWQWEKSSDGKIMEPMESLLQFQFISV